LSQILVDYREKPGKRERQDQVDLIRRIGVKAEKTDLTFGDFAFEGNGPNGPIAIGIERKRLHDMLTCIDDARYSAHQLVGMRKLYDVSCLLIEGIWRPHDPKGLLMESRDGSTYFECKPGGRPVLYSKLRRYLFSVQLSGVLVLYTRDLFQTCYDVCELYHYFQKKWKAHTSLLEKQKLNIPSLNGRPSLVRRWAEELDGVGLVHGEAAVRMFKTPIGLAMSGWEEWACIPRIGVETAKNIVAQIEGKKR